MNGAKPSGGQAWSNFADLATVEELAGCGHKCKPCFRSGVQMDASIAQLLESNDWEMLTIEKALASLDKMAEQPSVDDFICILQKCRKQRNLLYANCLHVHICENGLEAHRVLGNYLVPMFAECGSMLHAQQVFNRLVQRNEYSWTSLIQGYVECGETQHALDLLQKMQEDCVHPSRFTFVALMKACARLTCVERAQDIHAEIVKQGFEQDPFVGSTLVDMYVKCGSLAEAQEVFEKLSVRDVVLWTALIAGYAEQGIGEEALNCLKQMQLEGICPDAHVFLCSLKACVRIGAFDKGREIHIEIAKEEFERNLFVGNTLVDMYIKCGSLAEGEEVFDMLPVRDVVSWNTLIAGYVQHGLGLQALNCLEQMQLEGVSPDVVTYACSLKACGSIGAIKRGQEMHARIAKEGFEGNPFVGNTLVDMYATCGSLAHAQEVFVKMPVQSVVSWNALIAGYAEHGLGEEAWNCLEQMELECMSPNAVTFVCSLKACGSIGAIEWGREIHAKVAKEGFEGSSFIGSSLVDMYFKCGLPAEAQKVFDKLLVQDVVSWNTLITGYADHDLGEDVLTCLKQMQLESVAPDAVTFVCSLKACGSLGAIDRGREIHAESVRKGFGRDPFIGNSLLGMYAKCGWLEEAREVFDMLPARDVISWTSLIAGYAEHELCVETLHCLEQMQLEGVSPDSVTFVCSLKACGSVGAIDGAHCIHAEIVKEGFEQDPFVGCTLVDVYAKCGSLAEAQELSDKLQAQDIALWNALIAGYAEYGLGEEALDALEQMQQEGMSPDAVTVAGGLKACGSIGALDRGREIHATIARDGFETDPFAHSTLVDMYAKCGSLIEAQEVFDKLAVQNIVSWTALIAGYAEHGLSDEALNCLEQMQLENVSPNAVTYTYCLKACGNIGAIGSGREIHSKITKEDFERDSFVGNTLVDMYAKCGSLMEAWKVFDKLPVPDVISWTALIAGYARQGESEFVFKLFERMQDEGLQPDEVTLLGVLTVCSHVGLVEVGQKYFNSMNEEYGLIPTIEHHNCMVDLLGRAGQVYEAVAMLEKMPFQPDLVTWSTLLAVCQNWGYADLGGQAFECEIG